jgi:hypothetical protein
MDLPEKGEVVELDRILDICRYYNLDALLEKIEDDPPPNPFKCEGCSFWFDRWRKKCLYEACFIHDLKYWAGHAGEHIERLAADAELMLAVARILGSTWMPMTMFVGVRLFGHHILKLSFSWGFGRNT